MQIAKMNGVLRGVPPWAVYLAGALPLAWVVWLGATGGLGIDPVKEIEHRLGKIALWFLVAGLAITPLRRQTGLSLLRQRRALGLLAFFYVALHAAVWLGLDMRLLWEQAAKDILKRPYLTAGMAALALLLPLALTSNDASVRWLGQGWRKLHRLAYPAAIAAGVHYLWQTKADVTEPLIWLAAILGLLALRLRR